MKCAVSSLKSGQSYYHLTESCDSHLKPFHSCVKKMDHQAATPYMLWLLQCIFCLQTDNITDKTSK